MEEKEKEEESAPIGPSAKGEEDLAASGIEGIAHRGIPSERMKQKSTTITTNGRQYCLKAVW